MSTKKSQIKKVSEKLIKIPWNNEKLIWNIEDILHYVDLLEEVDITWVQPTISVVETWTAMREDIEIEKEVLPKELLNCSNQKVVANQIIIPNIMK